MKPFSRWACSAVVVSITAWLMFIIATCLTALYPMDPDQWANMHRVFLWLSILLGLIFGTIWWHVTRPQSMRTSGHNEALKAKDWVNALKIDRMLKTWRRDRDQYKGEC